MTSLRIRSFGLIALAAAALAGPLAGTALATPVTSTGSPTIAGTPTQGDTLTLTPGTYTGDSTPVVTEQWMDCSSSDPTTCTTPISGATGGTYTLQSSDVGQWVAVVETATNTDSATMLPTSVMQTSNVLGQVAAPDSPTNVKKPAITGTTTSGRVLTESGDTWTGSPTTFTYQWLRCTTTCAPIANANGKTYTLTDPDVGATIEVQMTASNGNPTPSATATSDPTATIVGAAPTSVNKPAITGTTTDGQVLTESGDTWTGSPTTFTYQWLRCTTTCAPIANANAKTYTLTDPDVGATIEVQMTASNGNPTPSATATSDPTATIVGAAPTSVNKPAITGTTTDGQVLTESGDTWTGSPTTFTYQWLRCTTTCTPITTNGTAKTYTLTDADVGATIEVQMTASNGNPTSATATSNPTATIVGATPTIVTSPTVSGTTALGQVLTETGDTWTGNPTAFTYLWLRCTTATSCTSTNGTAKTYTLVAADVGDTMEVEMTASNTNPTPSAPAFSPPSGTVVPPPPSYVAPPTISGTAQSGQTLTEGAAKWGTTWPPTSPSAVRWYRCDSNNLNCALVGTGSTYRLTDADVGATMQVWETATNAGGSTTNYSGFSAAVTNAQQIVPAPTVVAGSTPTVAGSAQLGRTLTGSGSQFNGNPGNFYYQWLRCNPLGCSSIPGANDLTYTPTSADVGDSIAFAETVSNSGGASAAVQSARTDTITAPSATTVQTNSSNPVAGQTVTLIATVTSAAGAVKPAGTVDFRSNGAAIPGCTALALGSAAPTAVCQTSFAASVANVTAAYSAAPGTFITGSTSSPTPLIVGRAGTSVTVGAPAHASLGARTTYTASVQPAAGSRLLPTGRVTFTDGGTTLKGCGSKALVAQKATCSVTYLGIKQHRISVRYGGDANFAPSASLTSHVAVQPQAPKGFVAVFMNWSFKFNLHVTRIALLQATGLSAGIHIAVSCSGGGCPFAHRTMTVVARSKCAKTTNQGCVAAPSFNLASIFHRARLHVGTKVAVAVTHRGWVGKYYRFTIRKGRKPAIDVSCLAVNSTRPGVGCSAR